jgi:4-hydroxy-4-methyl-2-oxoglutarate aldolase
VFARGLCIQGTGKDFGARGWLNAPVPMGDVVVHAGDLIVGDGDGVVAIPRLSVAETIKASIKRDSDEAAIMARLRKGEATMDVYGWNR